MSKLSTMLYRTVRACVVLCLVPVAATAQRLKPNWQNLDLQSDSVFGMSTERAYTELLKTRTSGQILVGVIDVGVDTAHEDLQGILWHNPREIPGNGVDDDHNGYVDDVVGWAFLDPSQKGTREVSLPDSAAIRAATSAAGSLAYGPGNPDVRGFAPDHGTHVAGIIAARRDNNLGIKGVADHVALVAVRAIPEGDERDEHVALAIRYAVDAGAKVINMSFGKTASPNKTLVDDAVKYAMSKDVLLIHAAGNSGVDHDHGGDSSFPTRSYADGSGQAGAWIEVGASGSRNDSTLVPSFSDYGKTSVDVFAPGVDIRSSVPGGYAAHSGTSMAAPMVTGVAALIRSQYPKLTALQVKEIIMRSVVKVDHDVMVGTGAQRHKVPFSEICVSGGVVNAYKALKLAAEYKMIGEP